MADGKASSGKKAIDYAEQTLKVNEVYQNALDARGALDKTLTELSEMRDKKRVTEETLSEAEYNIVVDERTKHPDMSQAQMDKHVKAAIHKDEACAGIRAQLREITGDLDGLEMDRDMHEADIKIATARLTQLGGYLQYLAVAKVMSQKGDQSASAVIPGW